MLHGTWYVVVVTGWWYKSVKSGAALPATRFIIYRLEDRLHSSHTEYITCGERALAGHLGINSISTRLCATQLLLALYVSSRQVFISFIFISFINNLEYNVVSES